MGRVYDIEMQGKTVLDVGGYDGRRALPCLDAGAKSAIVIDNGQWQEYGDWDAPVLVDPRIKAIAGDFMKVGKPADVVLCFLVIYHVPNPLRGLRRLRQLTKQHLAIASSVVSEEEAGPDGWRWYRDGMGHPTGTVWARPTAPALQAALVAAHFRDIRPIEWTNSKDEVAFACRRG